MHQVAPISFEWRVLNNPVRGYFPFFVIGLSLTAFQAGMFLEMGASIHTELRNLSELSRISVRRLLAVKFLIHWLFSFAAFGLILLALVTWGQVDNRASLWQLSPSERMFFLCGSQSGNNRGTFVSFRV